MKKSEVTKTIQEQIRVDAVKDFIIQIDYLDEKVRNRKNELEQIRTQKYSIRSIRLSDTDGCRVGKVGHPHGHDEKLVRNMDAERRAIAKLDRAVEQRDRFRRGINEALDRIPDEKARDSLRLTYFENLSATEIGKRYGVDGRTVRRWKVKGCLLFPLPADWEQKVEERLAQAEAADGCVA